MKRSRGNNVSEGVLLEKAAFGAKIEYREKSL